MNSYNLAQKIAQLILEKKGSDVVILDLKKLKAVTDFFVICSADSDIQVKAITRHVKDELIFESIRPWHIEKTNNFTWVLMDFVDVVVHIFQPDTRRFYGLERLWGDAKFYEIKDENETSGIFKK
ncbi:ribosome silencing factor [candidate division KSB1 bacterium]|nr:ribosome silencing factor [candidate division KSB1 bacterium]